MSSSYAPRWQTRSVDLKFNPNCCQSCCLFEPIGTVKLTRGRKEEWTTVWYKRRDLTLIKTLRMRYHDLHTLIRCVDRAAVVTGESAALSIVWFRPLCPSRSNCFEVFAANGAAANILQFCTAAESTDWLQAISTNISELTQEKVSLPLNVSWAQLWFREIEREKFFEVIAPSTWS